MGMRLKDSCLGLLSFVDLSGWGRLFFCSPEKLLGVETSSNLQILQALCNLHPGLTARLFCRSL